MAMETVDVQQLVDNLKGTLSHREIINKAGLKKINVDAMQRALEDVQNLLDLHLEVCPELHTPEILFIRK